MNNLLDKIDNWTQSGPMGNDKMNPLFQNPGMWLGLISAIISQTGQPKWEETQEKLQGFFENTADRIGKFDERADEFFNKGDTLFGQAKSLFKWGTDRLDAKSDVNQDRYQQFSENAADTLTTALRNNTRQNNSLGIYGKSGGQNVSNANAITRDLSTRLNQTWQNYMNQSTQEANTLFGKATSMYNTSNQFSNQGANLNRIGMQYQSDIDNALANAWINHTGMQAGNRFDFFGQTANSLFSNAFAPSNEPMNPNVFNIYNTPPGEQEGDR
jgi:hypothetical protein